MDKAGDGGATDIACSELLFSKLWYYFNNKQNIYESRKEHKKIIQIIRLLTDMQNNKFKHIKKGINNNNKNW